MLKADVAKLKNTLLEDLMLLAKNHYGDNFNSVDGMLAVFQEWTGTKSSTYKDLLHVLLPMILTLPKFKAMSPERLADVIQAMVFGPFWMGVEHRTKGPGYIALMALRDELSRCAHSEVYENADIPWPEPNSTLKATLMRSTICIVK